MLCHPPDASLTAASGGAHCDQAWAHDAVSGVAGCTRAVRGRSDTRRTCCRSASTMESSDRLPTARLAIDLPQDTHRRSDLSSSRNQRMACRVSPRHPLRAPQTAPSDP